MIDRVGQQLGNYQLVRLLGKGGFAQVYLGEHLYLKTQAAIKVLQVELGDEQRDDFLGEARTIAHLVHPHIVRVLDFGVEGNTPFLVMDYAPNGTLRHSFPKGVRPPLANIASYVSQVADALQYAHSQHVIHRDIKPGNMLLSRENEVLLSDFGIALIAHDTASQITEHEVVGSIAYMAPEQISGKPRPASDQYSLGVVVYEWLCGGRPFQGSFTEIVSQQMMAPPPPLRSKAPDVSPEIEEAVMVALAKDPRERFASVQAFAHALEQAIASETLKQARPGSYPYALKPVTGPQGNSRPIYLETPVASQSTASPPNVVTSRRQELLSAPPKPFTPPASPAQRVPAALRKAPGLISKQVNRVRNGIRRGMMALVGIALFGGCLVLAQYTTSYTNVILLPTITLAFVLSCIANVMISFFGAAYGPLVGLLTGLGGIFVADNGGSYLFTAAQQAAIHDWRWYTAAALLGLFTGLITRGALGKRRSTRVLLAIDILAAIGVDLGFLRFLSGNELLSAIALTVLLLHLSLIGYNATKMRKA